MAEQIKEGDVVKLKSGGVAMTVDTVLQGKHANCVWHNGNEPKFATYALTSLEKAEPFRHQVSSI